MKIDITNKNTPYLNTSNNMLFNLWTLSIHKKILGDVHYEESLVKNVTLYCVSRKNYTHTIETKRRLLIQFPINAPKHYIFHYNYLVDINTKEVLIVEDGYLSDVPRGSNELKYTAGKEMYDFHIMYSQLIN